MDRTAAGVARLRQDVEAIARPGGRVVGSEGNARARAFLVRRMAEVGLEPLSPSGYELSWTPAGHRVEHANLVGRIAGSDSSLAPLMVTAHHDTCGPQPGADDNAAAIAILLSLCERWRAAQLERELLVAFCDAEEPPCYHGACMGSTVFVQEQVGRPLLGGVALDLCGHDLPIPGAEPVFIVTGAESHPGLRPAIRELSERSTMSLVPIHNRAIGNMSDHHVFEQAGRPFLFFTCGEWPHYHQPTDTPDRLNYEKMWTIGEAVFEAVVAFARAGEPVEDAEPDPTIGLELAAFERHLGAVVRAVGLPLPSSRQELNGVVSRLRSQAHHG